MAIENIYGPEDGVFIQTHPLIQHKITKLRDKNTGTNEFRKLIEEIAMLMGFEALRDLPLEDIEVEKSDDAIINLETYLNVQKRVFEEAA
jgi:uracil phosphoribosyltransferase